MLKYGFVGNMIYYGVPLGLFCYIGFELKYIGDNAPMIPEEVFIIVRSVGQGNIEPQEPLQIRKGGSEGHLREPGSPEVPEGNGIIKRAEEDQRDADCS